MTKAEDQSTDSRETKEEKIRRIRLTLFDRETGKSKPCTLDEAETWDWANPDVWRMIDGSQITSYAGLLDELSLKIDRGCKEAEILVMPRFMMLAGG